MTTRTLGVGLIGANPDMGWGSSVHVPALRFVEGLELVAVGTTREESARRSAEVFGAAHAFSDPEALVACPDVDIVAIAVKAPDHHHLAMMALRAGKHVYCEWPLAANVGQAEEMAALAAEKDVCALVGLQARGAPALRQARDLVRQGHIGPLVAVRLACALPGGGRRRSREGLYVIDRKNGASTFDIQGGHAIDALRFCVGEIIEIGGIVLNHYDEVEVIETGEHLPKDAPDQILATGRLENGAAVSIAIHGGIVAGHSIAMELFGEEGTIRVGWPGPLNFQMSDLRLEAACRPDPTLADVPIGEGYDPGIIPPGVVGRAPYPGVAVPRATLVNVANLYSDLRAAICEGGNGFPDFRLGLDLHRLLGTIEASSATGIRQGRFQEAHEIASLRRQQK